MNNYANQSMSIPLLDVFQGDFTLQLKYMPYVRHWVYCVTYNDIVINNICLVVDLNCLRPWRNILPFGLRCLSNDGGYPFLISDFSEDICSIYILDTKDEIFEKL